MFSGSFSAQCCLKERQAAELGTDFPGSLAATTSCENREVTREPSLENRTACLSTLSRGMWGQPGGVWGLFRAAHKASLAWPRRTVASDHLTPHDSLTHSDAPFGAWRILSSWL